ncbi:unnamed protein product [Oikopleura dioica]|nr:unnamed protein product [Oikopleura dioica]
MAMIHELPQQRNVHLTGYSRFSEDSNSLASEMTPACRPRTSRRGSKRLSIKDVFSSSMLSVLSRSQSTSFSSEADSAPRVSAGSSAPRTSSSSRKRVRHTSRPPSIARPSTGCFITDHVTLPNWTGDDFISDCLTSIKPGLRATPANLSSRTISLPNCSASCPSMTAKARSHTRSKSSQ